jgi:transposase InsO family protein
MASTCTSEAVRQYVALRSYARERTPRPRHDRAARRCAARPGSRGGQARVSRPRPAAGVRACARHRLHRSRGLQREHHAARLPGSRRCARDDVRPRSRRRVHAELVLGRGIRVGHNAVAMLVQRAGIAGRNGARKWRGVPGLATAEDLVDRIFRRERPNQLWLTDITEHPTREGKVYCAVVLDAFSRRVVGWSISHNPTAGLTTNALGMAIEQRDASRGTA